MGVGRWYVTSTLAIENKTIHIGHSKSEMNCYPRVRVLSVDIGGTSIRSAQIDLDSAPRLHSYMKIPTPSCKRPDEIVDAVVELVQKSVACKSLCPIDCIGVCSTGVVDHVSGTVIRSVNLPFHGFPLRQYLSEKLSRPIVIDNDAKAGALGEFHFGAGQDKKWNSMVYIVAGTGIGGALIHHGELLRGVGNLSGEFGHMSLDIDGPPCRCGRQGCIDVYSSGYGIVSYVKSELELGVNSILMRTDHLGLPEIASAANSGDRLAIGSLERAGRALGFLLADIQHALNPEAFVLGGGVLCASRLIWKHIVESAHQLSFRQAWEKSTIERASLGEVSGLYGIAVLAAKAMSQQI